MRIDPKEVLQQMKNHGEVLAIGYYSGGDDEGGCEDVTVYKWSESLPAEWKPQNITVELIKGKNPEDIPGVEKRGHYEHECCIQAFFEQIVWDEYSTFAGEFYTNGTMTIIAPNGIYPEGMIDVSGQDEVREWVEKDVFHFPKED